MAQSAREQRGATRALAILCSFLPLMASSAEQPSPKGPESRHMRQLAMLRLASKRVSSWLPYLSDSKPARVHNSETLEGAKKATSDLSDKEVGRITSLVIDRHASRGPPSLTMNFSPKLEQHGAAFERALLEILQSTRESNRCLWALLYLKQNGVTNQKSIQVLLDLAEDGTRESCVRCECYHVIGRTDEKFRESITLRILGQLSKEKDGFVTDAMLWTLARIGGSRATKYLQERFRPTPNTWKRSVAEKLALLGDEGSAQLLAKALECDDTLVVVGVARALCNTEVQPSGLLIRHCLPILKRRFWDANDDDTLYYLAIAMLSMELRRALQTATDMSDATHGDLLSRASAFLAGVDLTTGLLTEMRSGDAK